MANEDNKVVITPGAAPVPFLYSDLVIDVALGAFVTRVTFGMENTSGKASPVVTVGIPTPSLIDFCRNYLSQVQKAKEPIEEKMKFFQVKLDEAALIDVSPELKRKQKKKTA